ncbi:hypothetical protein BC941DRAFT_445336 [Chlamydoabsidia padenii]|nr:hypothetical protein BC941DRAFT_445336 [Chlamydoabsidia padenii]
MDYDEEQHLYKNGFNIKRARFFSSRTQHGLTRAEMIQGMANRLLYSNFYIALYLCLGILSLVSIIMCLQETCPSRTFILFEAIINFAMIIEVTIRVLALRKTYWQSLWNVVDIILVGLCVITLILLATGCSTTERTEAIFDSILLIIRNCFQFFRLCRMAKKNKYSIYAKTTRIDFNNLPDERPPSNEYSRDDRLRQSFYLDDDDDPDLEQDRF